MPTTPPLLLRLPRAFAVGQLAWARVLDRALDAGVRARAAWRYALCPDERRFVAALLSRHSQVWCWRADQQARSGDFVIVDMSSADPRRRAAFVVDVKLQAPLVQGGGGAGIQLSRAGLAVDALRQDRVIGTEVQPTVLSGDRRHLVRAISRRSSR